MSTILKDTSSLRRLYKIAALGWKPTNYNITDSFAKLHARNMVNTGGIMGGAVGYGLASLATYGSLGDYPKNAEKIPEYEPKSDSYIGRAYQVPTSMESLQALHKLIVGKRWERSAPRIFEWMLDSREERLKKSIREAIRKGKADTSKLSDGELASLVFPYILKKDRSTDKYLSILRPYPIADTLIPRGLNSKDIENQTTH